MELASLLVEYFFRKNPDVRSSFQFGDLAETIRGRLTAFEAENLEITESYVLRQLETWHPIDIVNRFYRRLRPRPTEKLLPSILAELEGLVDRADDDKASVLVAETAQLRRILKQHQRVAILGAPGAGKTTLLQYVALAYAREKAGDRKLCQHGTLRKRLGTKQWRLPLLIPLVSIAGPLTKPREDGTDRSVLDVLSGILPPDLQGEPVALKYFSKQLDAGNCIVLLDGLDEVATETEFRAVVRAIESMAVKYGNNQFLLTSREAGWRGGVGADFSIFYVNDLTGTQAEAFIDSWYGAVERNAVVGRLEDEGHAERKERQRRATHRASELKSALKENIGIRRLATNPMLLSIIALVHRSLATLPKERAKLYSECAKILLEQWDISRGVRVDDTNLKLEQKESLMRRLAMAFHNGEIGERGGSREAPRQDVERILQDQLPALGRPKEEAQHLLQRLIERSGIITERRREVLSFSHLTFQEYFAAQSLACGNPRESIEFLLNPTRMPSDWWHEVILLYAGLVPDSSELVRRIYDPATDSVFRPRLRLAGLCMAEAVAIEDHHVRQDIGSGLLKVRLKGKLGRTGASISREILSYLVRWSAGDRWHRYAAESTMSEEKIGPAAWQEIIAALDGRRPELCVAAVTSLPLLPPELISGDVLEAVLRLLSSKDESIRIAAAKTLAVVGEGRLRGDGVLQLVRALGDETSGGVASSIITALEAQQTELRGNEQARELLGNMHADQRPEARRSFVQAFKVIADQATGAQVAGFLKLRSDPDDEVRWRFPGAAQQIVGNQPADELKKRVLELLGSDDGEARSFSVLALGSLPQADAARYCVVDKLSALLRDGRVSEVAAQSLIKLGKKGLSADVSTAARSLLWESKSSVQVAAMGIIRDLGQISVTDDVIARLLELLSGGSAKVRSGAAQALAHANASGWADVVFQNLISASSRGNTEVRVSAVESLGVIGARISNSGAIDAVVSALSDPKREVRTAAARAMRKLGQRSSSKEAIDALLRILTEGAHSWGWSVQFQPVRSFAANLVPGLNPDLRLTRVRFRNLDHSSYEGEWFVNVKVESELRAEAAGVLAVIVSSGEALRILESLGKALESATSVRDHWLSAKLLEAMAELGSRTMPELTLDKIVTVLRKRPELLALSETGYDGHLMYFPTRVIYATRYSARRQSEDLHESPFLVAVRMVPPKIAAERVEILLREPSAVLRFQTLEALRALGSSIITPILAESASKSLQDEAEAVREMAWGVVENYMKHAGAST